MNPDLLYLVKANVVLTLFVAAYYGLLRQLTFFQLNRFYLVAAALFAAVYPSVSVPALLPASAASMVAASAWGALPAPPESPPTGPLAVNWQVHLLRGYCLGAGLLVGQLLVQLLSLALVRRRARPAVVLGQPVRLLREAKGSFSFGRSIYVSEAAVADPAALAPELRHEQAHVRQWHTLDVLLAQLTTALAWFNPAVWLWRRAVLENLEYLADRATVQSGLERRAYQYSLLRQQPGRVPAPALAFRFSASELKKRIARLNQPSSPRRQVYRYVLAAPTVMALALGHSGARARPGALLERDRGLPVEALYYLDGQASDRATIQRLAPQDIRSVDWVEGAAAVRRVVATPPFQQAVVVTTNAQAESRVVRELADRADLGSGYHIRALPVEALLPACLAYVAEHYPRARLSGEVREYTKKSTGAAKLQVQLVIGESFFYVYFLPNGEFLRGEEQ
ncbi:M56 family metallopeptidase [Hymenobacter arizonensis]|uniref:Signal transducer regulating beta-lactamase production, contains metallopeptidase domain n=1 Tax=Hymenobacter arizonensis TaxID=1227077 RepID=A0A1I6BED1_HYMAR|nr:M56 family metallopeptidase [Hymenobacter arizonensis]SFQ79264.1 Signal transducer regulating beta-lactamase production, contains metallopeptidase domain [Hymenobacter arizonensis]